MARVLLHVGGHKTATSFLQGTFHRNRALLARHGVHAATGVTGLGLLGHLVEMARASGVEARVQVGSIPVLDGAREMAAAGVFPSVQPANMRRAVRNADAAQRLPAYPLLFDPQTTGGLLASVPAARAAACIAHLHTAGYKEAAIIGSVQALTGAGEPVALV